MISGRTAVIAHRGASAHAPENTFEAFDLALTSGADVLELDIRAAADGALTVLHDETLARTAGDPRALDTLDQMELERLPEKVRPPTLEAVLGRYGRATTYLLDLKEPRGPLVRDLVRTLRIHELLEFVQVQSFDRRGLRLVHRTEPRLELSQLYPVLMPARLVIRDLRRVAEFAQAVGPEAASVDAALVAGAHRLGLRVQPYTVNDRAEIDRLVTLGVDGLITDVPGQARDALRSGRGLAA